MGHALCAQRAGKAHDEPRSWVFQYNANGAMTQKAFTPTGATEPTKTWTYGWNRQNRLSTVHYNGTHVASYLYDPFGRRTKKTVHSSITGGVTGTTYYLYNDTGLVAEYTQTGQLKTEYHYVPGSHWSTNPLFARDGETNEIYYAATDQLGTATALIKSSGQVVWKAEKTAFGKTTVTAENNNAGNPVRFNLRFPGQYEDQETGLHYNWRRYYDSQNGRYLSSDPIGLKGGLNLYNYVGSQPLTMIDPYGLAARGAGIGAAIGGAIGGFVGAVLGGGGGAIGGTLVAPGVGTVGGGALGAVEGAAVGALAGAAIGAMVGDLVEDAINMWNESSEDTVPDLPTDLVGDNPRDSSGKRKNTDAPPESFPDIWDDLTGGVYEDDPDRPGHKVCPNGVRGRPTDKGPRIDIPGNDDKPPETIHFPPGTPWPL